ncbi:hypothetical protein HN446_02000 [bacterium]|jgi:hypothetical protein|nr:hypothetical protein [bacterium]
MLKKIFYTFSILISMAVFLYLMSFAISYFDKKVTSLPDKKEVSQVVDKKPKDVLAGKPGPYILNKRWADDGWEIYKQNKLYLFRNLIKGKEEEFNTIQVDPNKQEFKEKLISNIAGQEGETSLILWVFGCGHYSLKSEYSKQEWKLITKNPVGKNKDVVEIGLLIPTGDIHVKQYQKLKEVFVKERAASPVGAITNPRILYDLKKDAYLVREDTIFNIPSPEFGPAIASTQHEKYRGVMSPQKTRV